MFRPPAHPLERGRASFTLQAWLLLWTVATAAGAIAQSAPPPSSSAPSKAAQAVPEPSVYDRIWSYAELYKNKDNPVLQSVKFTGRFQLEYALVEASQGQRDELNIRRFRLGPKLTLCRDFTLHVEVDLDPDHEPVYRRLTDAYLSWSRSRSLVVTAGKHGALFTMDGSTSSKDLIAIDRGNLANNLWFPEEYMPGVSVSGRPAPWVYHLGVYSSGSRSKEFGNFDGGYFSVATIGYDFGKRLGVKEAVLAANYVFNDPDEDNTFTRSLHHVASVNFKLDTGRCGVRADLSGGAGYLGQSDLWGAMLMPFYNVTDKFQVVGRYTFLSSDDPRGVRLARYENTIVTRRGDEYHEFYLGLNYYFYGHKLKLQTGLQYAELNDRSDRGGEYSGWGWTTGVRISW